MVALDALLLLALPSGGHATAGYSSGLRGLGYTRQERPSTVPLQGALLLQSITCTRHSPPSTIGPLTFHASASDASSGVS